MKLRLLFTDYDELIVRCNRYHVVDGVLTTWHEGNYGMRQEIAHFPLVNLYSYRQVED